MTREIIWPTQTRRCLCKGHRRGQRAILVPQTARGR